VAEKLAQDDPDPLVRSFAAATADSLRNPPATQPGTQPTTQPGAPAGAAGAASGAAAGDQRSGGGASPVPSGISVPSEPPAGAAKGGG
jgi:hypothetical protein